MMQTHNLLNQTLLEGVNVCLHMKWRNQQLFSIDHLLEASLENDICEVSIRKT
jgi:hypothetical protein